jgi:H+-transporting ATPase
MMTIAGDRVKSFMYSHSWNLSKISTFAVAYGIYLSASTILFFTIIKSTFFQTTFAPEQFSVQNTTDVISEWNDPKLHSIIYLQVSIISQALIFVTRSRGFFFMEYPSLILIGVFAITQLFATLIAVYVNWSFTDIQGCGWSWAAIVWFWDIGWLYQLDSIKVN